MIGLAAVILAGGRARRMGGVAKPLLELDGATLLQRTVDAARSVGDADVVVAGPPSRRIRDVRWVREDPPFGGPVAGLAAALPSLRAEWVLVLPADLVAPADAVADLLRVATTTDGSVLIDGSVLVDGSVLIDGEGREQWLTGIYRVRALRQRVAALRGDLPGLSFRSLIEGLDLHRCAADGRAADIDTWDHLREARSRAQIRTETDVAASNSRTLPPEALDAWAAALRTHFDLAEEDLPVTLILDLARDVANGVARPAAPFSTFVAGLVAGRAGGSPDQVRAAVAEISRLAADRTAT